MTPSTWSNTTYLYSTVELEYDRVVMIVSNFRFYYGTLWAPYLCWTLSRQRTRRGWEKKKTLYEHSRQKLSFPSAILRYLSLEVIYKALACCPGGQVSIPAVPTGEYFSLGHEVVGNGTGNQCYDSSRDLYSQDCKKSQFFKSFVRPNCNNI